MPGQLRVVLRNNGRIGGGRGLRATVVALLLAIVSSGCVPIPYKPSASVSHAPVTAEEASAITLSLHNRQVPLGSLSKSIQHAEPRVVVVDGTQFLARLTGAHPTLADALAAYEAFPAAEPSADYLLCVGTSVHRKLHDTGLAGPFPYFPVFWVGYEKVQSRDSLTALLVDLHASKGAERLQVSSTYSEVIAAFAYGVATIARPQAAMKEALAHDVASTVASAHSTGPIRIIVVAHEGGTVEADPYDTRPPPRRVMVQAQRAGH